MGIEKVGVFVSPFIRTQETAAGVLSKLDPQQVSAGLSIFHVPFSSVLPLWTVAKPAFAPLECKAASQSPTHSDLSWRRGASQTLLTPFDPPASAGQFRPKLLCLWRLLKSRNPPDHLNWPPNPTAHAPTQPLRRAVLLLLALIQGPPLSNDHFGVRSIAARKALLKP